LPDKEPPQVSLLAPVSAKPEAGLIAQVVEPPLATGLTQFTLPPAWGFATPVTVCGGGVTIVTGVPAIAVPLVAVKVLTPLSRGALKYVTGSVVHPVAEAARLPIARSAPPVRLVVTGGVPVVRCQPMPVIAMVQLAFKNAVPLETETRQALHTGEA
jgi:hypothetical protein